MKARGHGHPLPATPELAAAFLAELAEEGLSVATLRLTKSALSAVHRSTGHQDPTDNAVVPIPDAGNAATDVDQLRGKTRLVPSTADNWGAGGGVIQPPANEWMPRRICADPPAPVMDLRKDTERSIFAACGLPPTLA